MRGFRALVLLLACLASATVLPADERKDDAVKKELDKVQGVWVWRAAEKEGEENNSERAEALSFAQRYTVKGDKWQREWKFGDMGGTVSGTVKIDPTTTPKSIDFTWDKGEINAGKTEKGVYELNGDELRLSWGELGKDDRPKAVKTKKGDNITVQVYKRKK